MVADPELFYRNCQRPVVVFDEIHQLRHSSLLLKVGADMFPWLRILATGSSTLAASEKFRDPASFDPGALTFFRSYYPRGTNYLVSPRRSGGYAKRVPGSRKIS